MSSDATSESPEPNQATDLPSTAFYLPEGDGFVSTVLTRGPWDRDFQHGGPPSALLTTVLLDGVERMSLARVTLEFLRPVPIATLRVKVEEVTEGRTVRRRKATLLAGDRPVLEARALFIRDLPNPAETFGDPWPAPDSQSPFTFPFFPWKRGYHQAVDVRVLDPPWGKTPVRCWARARVPLIHGRPTRPEAHTLILADAESGMGPPVDPMQWTYLNPDLTVYFGRLPAAGWLGLDIRSFAGDLGGGLSEARLRDERGVFGRSAQSLVVQQRDPE